MTLSDKPIAWNGGGAGPDESAPLPRPVHMDALAEECLQALAGSGLAHLISVGGALGLMHYLDYRGTHDADAWWAESVSTLEREQVIAVIVRTLARHGDVRTRAWGDVVSIELSTLTRVSFSFQIARRSARLAACRRAAWAEVWVDSLEDVVAAKMAALVERGAPRDFRDIFAICQAGIILPADCWCLWARRQTQSGVAPDRSRANLAIQTHLERIALHRPLDSISDPKERETAARVRHWFNEEFSCAGQ